MGEEIPNLFSLFVLCQDVSAETENPSPHPCKVLKVDNPRILLLTHCEFEEGRSDPTRVRVKWAVFTVRLTAFERLSYSTVGQMHSGRRIHVVIEPRVVSSASAHVRSPSSLCVVCVKESTDSTVSEKLESPRFISFS